jgi:hypothetical protein
MDRVWCTEVLVGEEHQQGRKDARNMSADEYGAKYGTKMELWVKTYESKTQSGQIDIEFLGYELREANSCPTCPGNTKLDYEYVGYAAKNGLNGSGYASAGLGAIQIGMSEYRSSLSIHSKVGTFSRFRISYTALGTTGKILGRAGNAGAVAGAILDYRELKANKISPSRFTFRLTGAASSILGGALIGAKLGGPYGALGGAGIGLIFTAGEIIYDGATWFWDETKKQIYNFENGIKSGWYPGR